MLSGIEATRLRLSKDTDSSRKAQLGQFFTPQTTAAFMATLFPDSTAACRLLDAGAGIGSLSAAFLDRWAGGGLGFSSVELRAFEIDQTLHKFLAQTLGRYSNIGNLSVALSGEDFIESAVDSLSNPLHGVSLGNFTHAILNPPYKKISSSSATRLALRRVSIETVNLYSAFVSLAIELAATNGQIVAIIPRSFCNGPYYRPFRELIFRRTAIRHLHLFESRNKAFKDDDVLQENIIIRLERNGRQGPVTVSTSTDDRFHDVSSHTFEFADIVKADDREGFIHIPTSITPSATPKRSIDKSLKDLGIGVSTGPIVDFRMKTHLRRMPEANTVPLLYPAHFSGMRVIWPIEGLKKPNAIEVNDHTKRWLYPNGHYCVVRRFSAKEERRRLVAGVINPSAFEAAEVLGIENHLNVFHRSKRGISKHLALGLAVFLNSTSADESFRRFSGHTQVNATDLRQMRYPSLDVLIELGMWAEHRHAVTQTMIDVTLEILTA